MGEKQHDTDRTGSSILEEKKFQNFQFYRKSGLEDFKEFDLFDDKDDFEEDDDF